MVYILRLFPEVLRTQSRIKSFNYITTYLFSLATFTSMNIVWARVVLCPDHYNITYFPALSGMEQLREKMATLSGSGKSTQCTDQETFWWSGWSLIDWCMPINNNMLIPLKKSWAGPDNMDVLATCFQKQVSRRTWHYEGEATLRLKAPVCPNHSSRKKMRPSFASLPLLLPCPRPSSCW